MHSSKKEAAKIKEAAEAEANGENTQIEAPILGGAEASINADADAGDGMMFFDDDCYRAMIDTE